MERTDGGGCGNPEETGPAQAGAGAEACRAGGQVQEQPGKAWQGTHLGAGLWRAGRIWRLEIEAAWDLGLSFPALFPNGINQRWVGAVPFPTMLLQVFVWSM